MTTPYVTIAEGDIYFESRLHSGAWDTATESNKTKSTKESTLIIDRLNYLGEKTSSAQENQFPRNDDSVIPTDIKYATCEIALALLDGVDPDLEYENLMMTAQQYANVRSTYDRTRTPLNIVAGVPSVRAWRYLQAYLRDHKTVDMNRIG